MTNLYPIIRNVGNEISLPVLTACSTDGEYLQKINCKHWFPNPISCSGICSIEEKNNPTKEDCLKCSKRETFAGEKKVVQSESTAKLLLVDIVGSKTIIQENLTKQNNIVMEKKENKKEKSFSKKAKDYLKAEASQATQGKVSQKVFEYRKKLCMECEFRIEKTPLGKEDSIGWCKGGCGCKVGNPRAALSEKLYMPTLSCPKNKFGPSKGEGFNVSDAVDSAKSVVKSVVNLFTEKKDS